MREDRLPWRRDSRAFVAVPAIVAAQILMHVLDLHALDPPGHGAEYASIKGVPHAVKVRQPPARERCAVVSPAFERAGAPIHQAEQVVDAKGMPEPGCR
jgi:hypothetical protein